MQNKEKRKIGKLSFILIGAVALAAILFFFTNPSGVEKIDKEVVELPPLEDSVKVKGNDSAPVTVVEYGDFQCGACANFYTNVLPTIEKNYIQKGKVKMEYKHFPLENIHKQALSAAMASECAREQGAFWQYHDILFENQALLKESSYKLWAERTGLDSAKFNQCYDSEKYKAVVKAESGEGSRKGVRSTPSFTVNGKLVQNQRLLQKEIEQALAKLEAKE